MDRVQKMRMKQREKAFAEKLAQGAQGLPEPVPVVQTPAASFPPPGNSDRKPEKPPKQPQKAMVKFRCGHEKPVLWFQGGDCGECREKTRREKAQRNREKLERLKAEGAARKAPLHEQGRLPDGAAFNNVVYDATAKMWSGTLSIPRGLLGHKSFSASASGVEALLRQLARECWDWLAQREQG